MPLDVVGRADAQRAVRRVSSWTALARGMSVREGESPTVLVLMGGWRITDASVRAWAEAVVRARPGMLNDATLVAVEGPLDVDFRSKELGVDVLLARLVSHAERHGPAAKVWVVAHSSGAHVAATMFDRAFRQRPSQHRALDGRVVYVDLDGDPSVPSDPERSLSAGSVSGLARIVFAMGEDRERGLTGLSAAWMRASAVRHAPQSELYVHDASASGCTTNLCVHLSLVNLQPLPRGNASYAEVSERTINLRWLDAAVRSLEEQTRP
ncbi:MAG: hypothetical protein Q8Q09_05790 [Deltaproteobacteria bacterium]|nr:hypothetical protein [Deltaproteobacteria bacterium]